MNQLNRRLREFRESKGWKQTDIAKQIGISSQLYGQYEREENPKAPGVDFYIKWKKAFGFDLMNDETEVSHETAVDEKDLKKAISDLSESTKLQTVIHDRDSRSIERLITLLELKLGVPAAVDLVPPGTPHTVPITKGKKKTGRAG